MPQDRLTNLLKPAVLDAGAYNMAESTDMIKLDAMENPFTWPAAVQQEWLNTLANTDVNRYPDGSASHIKKILRRVLNIPASHGVLLGNGSDEIIQILLLSLRPGAGLVLVPEPTFIMYRLIAAYTGLPFQGVPLGANFELDHEAMIAAIKQHQPGIIFLASPNNPTGNVFNQATVESIIEAAPGLVVLDEAYYVFAGQNMAGLSDKYDHVLIMRTLSKLGLAGLRIGILSGTPQWIAQFDKIRLPYNIGTLNQEAMAFIADHMDVLTDQARILVQQRDVLFTAMNDLEQVRVWPSQANFLLFKINSAGAVYQALRNKGILVKNLDNTHPQTQDCLRVTIGTAEQNALFLQTLKQIVQAPLIPAGRNKRSGRGAGYQEASDKDA